MTNIFDNISCWKLELQTTMIPHNYKPVVDNGGQGRIEINHQWRGNVWFQITQLFIMYICVTFTFS